MSPAEKVPAWSTVPFGTPTGHVVWVTVGAPPVMMPRPRSPPRLKRRGTQPPALAMLSIGGVGTRARDPSEGEIKGVGLEADGGAADVALPGWGGTTEQKPIAARW